MNTRIRLVAAAPGEAAIIVENQAGNKGQNFNVTFPQFPSIPMQRVLRQEIQENNLVLVIDADQLSDILEAGSPCQLKIPELGIVQTVIWPVIVGKRSHDRQVINTQAGKTPVQENRKAVLEDGQPALEQSDKENKSGFPGHEAGMNSIGKCLTPEKPQAKNLENGNPEKRGISSFVLFIGLAILFLFLFLFLLLSGAFTYWHKSRSASEKTMQSSGKKMETSGKKPFGQEPSSQKEKKANPSAPNVDDKDQINQKTDGIHSQDVSPSPKTDAALTQGIGLDHMSVNEVLNKSPNTVVITKEGERRLKNGQADDGILLLEDAASKGDNEAMLTLGLLYDPVGFKAGGPIPNPDMRESARYFQKAEQSGSKEVIVPRQALYGWLSEKAGKGDEMARLTLKDFWP